MAVSFISQVEKGFGGEPRATYFSFAPNGAANPLVANNQGPPGIRASTVTYTATGVYTVTFHPDFGVPATTTFLLSAQCASLAAYFGVIQVGAYNPATRQLVVQAIQAAAGFAVPAAAGARVHVGILFNDSTGG